MQERSGHSPLTSYFFIFLLFLGGIVFLSSFFLEGQRIFFSSMQQLGLGILGIGIGEWINHPLQKSLSWEETKKTPFRRIYHRRRNPSSLGNLFEIFGLVLLFVGLAGFL